MLRSERGTRPFVWQPRQAWAGTFHNLDTLHFSGTPPEEPLHNVQLYTFGLEPALTGFPVLWRRKRALWVDLGAKRHGQPKGEQNQSPPSRAAAPNLQPQATQSPPSFS